MRPTVAVIDADATTRQSLCTLLATLDVEVESFDSAEAWFACTGISSHHADCVIADVSLPGMSGRELLRRLRHADTDLPVILLADGSDVPTAVAAMREGATDFIEKPHVDTAVLRRVSRLLKEGLRAPS